MRRARASEPKVGVSLCKNRSEQSMFLERLGADAAVSGAFSPYAQQEMVLARVATAQRDFYHLYIETGIVNAEASGGLYCRSQNRVSLPVTGDWVAARI